MKDKPVLNKYLRAKLKEIGVLHIDSCIMYLLGHFFNLKDVPLITLNSSDIQLLIEHKLIQKKYSNGDINVKIILPLFNIEEEPFTKEQFEELRGMWRGLFKKSMGDYHSAYKNLLEWFKKHPEYTFDDVQKACAYYLAKMESECSHKFTRRFQYFISKETDKGPISDLKSYIEESVILNTMNTDNNWNEETL